MSILGLTPEPIPSPAGVRVRITTLKVKRDTKQAAIQEHIRDLADLNAYLDLAPRVERALETLSQDLFAGLVRELEAELSRALEDVLGQPLQFKVETEWLRGAAAIKFSIHRDGQPEDIMRGQGGSVVNILSVGLRIFALLTLDPKTNRRFLVLDEPDAWLRPDIVPNLVKIIYEITRRFGFQVILVSHHDVSMFESLADKIYRFHPRSDGSVAVRLVGEDPSVSDGEQAKPVVLGTLDL